MLTLISSSLLLQVLSAFATRGDVSPSRSMAGPAVWSCGLQASARAEPSSTTAVGYGDGGWVSAGGWSPEDLSFPLASVRVGVCTRTCSQNKSVPVWEISVKSVFCKSWPGSCFHITNQKQLAVFFGASAFPNQCTALSLPLEKGREGCAPEPFLRKASPWRCISILSRFGGAGHPMTVWAMCDCSSKGRRKPCWGMGTNLQKSFSSPDAYKKGTSTDTLDLAVSLPLYKPYLLQPSRNLEQRGFFRFFFFFLPKSAWSPEAENPVLTSASSSCSPMLGVSLIHYPWWGGKLLIAVSCKHP